jgi:hypothetical protein
MIIVIPSYWRSKFVTTTKILPEATIVVPKSQFEEYKKQWYKNIDRIPDDQDGNISKKRNAILKKYKWEDIVMLDDDILKFQKIRLIRSWNETRQKTLKWEEIINMFSNILNQLKKTKKTIWWIYPVSYPISQRKLKEITYKWFIIWTCMIFTKENELVFDENFSWKEDHDISIRAILKNNLLRFNHYSFTKISNQKIWWVSQQRISWDFKDIELANKLVSKYKPHVMLNKKRIWEISYNFR